MIERHTVKIEVLSPLRNYIFTFPGFAYPLFHATSQSSHVSLFTYYLDII